MEYFINPLGGANIGGALMQGMQVGSQLEDAALRRKQGEFALGQAERQEQMNLDNIGKLELRDNTIQFLQRLQATPPEQRQALAAQAIDDPSLDFDEEDLPLIGNDQYIGAVLQQLGGTQAVAQGQKQQATPSDIVTFEYFQNLSPEEQKLFIESKRGQQATPEQLMEAERQKAKLELTTAQTKKEQELGVKDLRDIADRGRIASGQVGTINRLEQLNDVAFDGAGAGILLQLGKIAKGFGFDVEGLTESELLSSLSNELVLGKSQQMSGALSNADMEFLQNTAPTLSQTKEGRKQIMQYARKLAERDREYAKAAQKFRSENGYFNLSEFNQQFDAENKPLFDKEQVSGKDQRKQQFLGEAQPRKATTIGRFEIVEEGE